MVIILDFQTIQQKVMIANHSNIQILNRIKLENPAVFEFKGTDVFIILICKN